jgi:purine catabolism regulator
MQRLNAAGLVLAVGNYMEKVPEVMLDSSERMGIPIIALPWSVNFRDVTHALLTRLVQSHYTFLESAERLNRDLLNIVMRGGGLAALCARLSRLLGRSVGVADPAMQLLAKHSAAPTGGLFRRDDLSPEALALAPVLRARAAVSGTQALDDGTRHLGTATPIIAASNLSGWLLVEVEREQVSRFDSLAAEAAAIVAALLLSQAAERARIAERRAEDRLIDILQGHRAATPETAEELGLRPDAPILVFTADVEGPNAAAAPGIVGTFLQRQGLVGQVALRGTTLLGVMQKPKGRMGRDMGTGLSEILDTARLHARLAVSCVLEDVAQLPRGYEEAREALRLGRLLQPDRRLVFAGELVALARFARAADLGQAGGVAFPSIIRLLQNDRSQQGSLVDSLECLLENEGNVSLAARRLNIHRHTLLYRIERIEQLLHVELTATMRLELRLQLIAWHLAGGPTHRPAPLAVVPATP